MASFGQLWGRERFSIGKHTVTRTLEGPYAVDHSRMTFEEDYFARMVLVVCTRCREVVMRIPKDQMDTMVDDEFITVAKRHGCFREEGLDENFNPVRMIRT